VSLKLPPLSAAAIKSPLSLPSLGYYDDDCKKKQKAASKPADALMMMTPLSTLSLTLHQTKYKRTAAMRNQFVWLLLGAVVGAAEASRQSWAPPAFFNRFQVGGWGVRTTASGLMMKEIPPPPPALLDHLDLTKRSIDRRSTHKQGGWEEEYEEEEEEGNGLGSLALKALVGAGVAAGGAAGINFARKAIQAKQSQRPGRPAASSSAKRGFVEGGIKGGKSEAKAAPATTKAAPIPPPSAAAAGAAGAEAGAEEAEEEEVFEVEPVVELEEASLSTAQLEHPYAKLLGPKLVKWDPKEQRLVEVATADVLDGKVTSLFFHAQQVEQMLEKMKAGKVLPGLLDVYKEQQAKGNNFEVVFVSLPDGQEGRFQSYLKEMPWYAVPFNSTETVRDAYKAFKVQNLPAAVIMDEQAELVNEKGFTYMLIDRDAFPWRPKTLAQMIGSKFVDNKGKAVPADKVTKKKVLGLYFSANWCKPCREFTPRLVELYEKLQKEGKDLEIAFVSMDESEEKFKEYFAEMPWVALPYDDKQARSLLMTELEVRGLPSLVILDEDRQVITTKGREFALKDPEGAKFPWHPQPLNEISYSFDGIAQKPSVVVFMEGASADAQEKIVAELQAVAEEYVRRAKADPEDEAARFNFFYAKEVSTFSKALRSIVGLEQLSPKDKFLKAKAESNKPKLVLMDIAKEACHISDAEAIDGAAVRAVLEARVEGSLPMESFRQPEGQPGAEAGAAGAAAGAAQ
jgi:nucleoredoxin